MENRPEPASTPRHLTVSEPSSWVRRFAPLVPADGSSRGTVLDLACGGGRHARLFLELGRRVVAVDRDTGPVSDLAAEPGAEVMAVDLEDGRPVFATGGPLAGRVFAGIVVVNYLHRALLPALPGALEDGGVLIYETFARGNERFTRPRHPDHLLADGELLDLARGHLRIIAYESGIQEDGPLPGVVQRLCAIRDGGGEAQPRPLHPRQLDPVPREKS